MSKIEENTRYIMANFVVLGEIPVKRKLNFVEFNSSEHVMKLRHAIYDKKKNVFSKQNIDESELILWKVDIPFDNENDKLKMLDVTPYTINIEQDLKGKELFPGELISDHLEHFYKTRDSIHILVQLQTPDTTERIQKKRRLWYENPKKTDIIQSLSDEAREVPVSQSEFTSVRESQLLYVDKTSWLAKLDLNSGQYFVSRPRKFGKSMFLSMVESFFLAQHDLFKNLDVYKNPPEIYVKNSVRKWNEPDLPPIPVIRLDFSNLTSNRGPEVLEQGLIRLLISIGKHYGLNLEYEDVVKDVTRDLIVSLASHEDNMYGKVVILVDEYDSPILNAFDATEKSLAISDQNREILKGFFEVVKSSQKHIKFCLVTGVSMFSNIELFSGPNQLTDLTMMDKLSGAYGFMEDEIVEVFKSKFSGEYSNINETMVKLQERYNGYSWDGQIKVYNPYSICSFFYELKLENFWIMKGRTSFLAKLISTNHIKSVTNEIKIKKDLIAPVTINEIMKSTEPPTSLLFQAGYLTIKKYEKKDLILEIPNNEVRDSLVTELWANSFSSTIEYASGRIEILANLLKNDKFLPFLKEFNNDLASVPYNVSQKASKYEGYYHSNIHMLIRYIGLPFHSEDASSLGRTDMWVELSESIYFIEYKHLEGGNVTKLIEKAVNQIFQNRYYATLTAEQYRKTKYAVGCVFSSKTRVISGVGIQKFTYESNFLDKGELETYIFN